MQKTPSFLIMLLIPLLLGFLIVCADCSYEGDFRCSTADLGIEDVNEGSETEELEEEEGSPSLDLMGEFQSLEIAGASKGWNLFSHSDAGISPLALGWTMPLQV